MNAPADVPTFGRSGVDLSPLQVDIGRGAVTSACRASGEANRSVAVTETRSSRRTAAVDLGTDPFGCCPGAELDRADADDRGVLTDSCAALSVSFGTIFPSGEFLSYPYRRLPARTVWRPTRTTARSRRSDRSDPRPRGYPRSRPVGRATTGSPLERRMAQPICRPFFLAPPSWTWVAVRRSESPSRQRLIRSRELSERAPPHSVNRISAIAANEAMPGSFYARPLGRRVELALVKQKPNDARTEARNEDEEPRPRMRRSP